LSGTSMAAPHISAMAAYLANIYGLTTPAQIEQQVRAASFSLISVAQGGAAINCDRESHRR
jgi:subtilisin family serine protease